MDSNSLDKTINFMLNTLLRTVAPLEAISYSVKKLGKNFTIFFFNFFFNFLFLRILIASNGARVRGNVFKMEFRVLS